MGPSKGVRGVEARFRPWLRRTTEEEEEEAEAVRPDSAGPAVRPGLMVVVVVAAAAREVLLLQPQISAAPRPVPVRTRTPIPRVRPGRRSRAGGPVD